MFSSPLAKHLTSGERTQPDGDQAVSRPGAALFSSAPSMKAEPRRPAFSYAASPSHMLRSRLTPPLKQTPSRAAVGRSTPSPLPPTTTLDEELGKLNLGAQEAAPKAPAAGLSHQPPDTVSTPKRQLPQHLLSTPGRTVATTTAQPLAARGGAAGGSWGEAASAQPGGAPPPQWVPLMASPSLGAAKAQGAGLLSVRKGGQPAGGPSPLQPSASGAGEGVPSSQQAQQQQQQQEGQPRALFTPPPAAQGGGPAGPGAPEEEGAPEVAGRWSGLAGARLSRLGSSGGGGGGGPGAGSGTPLQHLAATKFGALSVRLHAAEEPAALRRELRSLVPDLPVGQYAPPSAAAAAQQPAGGGGGSGKPAFVEGGAAAAGVLDRLRALQREGERLAEEGAGMDRAFVGLARPLLAAAAATPPTTPPTTPADAGPGHTKAAGAAPTKAVTVPAAARAGAPTAAAAAALAKLRALQQQGAQLAAGLGS